MTSVPFMKTDTPVLDIRWPFLMQMVLDIWWPFLMQMVYQQVCILVGCVPPVRNCTVRGVSLTEIPLHRDPLDRDSPSQTKNPLDRDPLDRDLLGQRPPGQRFPTSGQIPLWTETPWQRLPLWGLFGVWRCLSENYQLWSFGLLRMHNEKSK